MLCWPRNHQKVKNYDFGHSSLWNYHNDLSSICNDCSICRNIFIHSFSIHNEVYMATMNLYLYTESTWYNCIHVQLQLVVLLVVLVLIHFWGCENHTRPSSRELCMKELLICCHSFRCNISVFDNQRDIFTDCRQQLDSCHCGRLYVSLSAIERDSVSLVT